MQSQSNTSILPKISPVSENILSNGSVGAPLESQEPSGFDKFSLSPKLKQALRRLSFNNPTDIQSQAIPFALTQRDIIASAQTGTGKTAAFSIPMITKLEQNPKLSALILVPTREIAAQIANVLKDLTFALPELRSALLIGGAAMQNQLRTLSKHPRILIATPGRLMDHLRRGSVKLNNTGILVLDEADRMLDMGFAPQLNEILKHVPKERQTLLFSATLPNDIENLARKYLQNPHRITVGQASQAAPKIEQTVVHASHSEKNNVLLDELNQRTGSILIFTRTKRRTDKLSDLLLEYGHETGRIHGDRSQAQRNSALNNFRAGKIRILVATDVAARGIDVPHIAHVINYDLPQTPDDYIHRIGRTARAGAKGEALSILTPEDNSLWRQISRMLSRSGSQAPTSKNAAKGDPAALNGASARVSPLSTPFTGAPAFEREPRGGGREYRERRGGNGGGRDFREPRRDGGRPGGRFERGPRSSDSRGQERSFGSGFSRDRGAAPAPHVRPDENRGRFGDEKRRPRSFF